MKIVLLLTDSDDRNLVVGPFPSVDDAESFCNDVVEVPWGKLKGFVTTICTPGEYLSVDDLNDLEIDPS